MKNEADAERLSELLAAALECTSPGRAAFLAQSCGEDHGLRAEIESLLRSDPADFLAGPAFVGDVEAFSGRAEVELKAGDVLGDCRIVSLLGVGGMGEVYLADDTVLGRQVAVKLIQRGQGGTLLSHFRHERRVLAGLTHPNIARLYGGAVTNEGRAYLVMEYAEGERLDDYCNQRRLGIAERLELFRKICGAVAYAHQHLVVHRDLKPANIRVTADGEPKLLDFGIAKLLDLEAASPGAGSTMTMQAMMTPEYASPEQLRGDAITTATDVYSLGVVLYELLSGQRPYRFKSRRPEEIVRAVCEQEPERPSTAAARTEAARPHASASRLQRRLAGDLDNIVARAMGKEPGRRYASVAQLAEDIRRHLGGLPILARRDTWAYRSGKFIRRNKAAVGALGFVLIALAAGLVVTTWQARVARDERDRARLAQAQTERINNFLQDLLSSASPQRRGHDVKVVEILDEAGRNLDRDLAHDPESLAQAHATMGRTYRDLQIYNVSEGHFQKALDLFRRLHGADSAVVLDLECDLAVVLISRSRYADAEQLMRQSLAVQHRGGDTNPYLRGRTLYELSQTLAATNRPREAEPLLVEALALIRAACGENSRIFVTSQLALGNLKLFEQEYDAAATEYRRTIALMGRYAPDSTDLVLAETNLCGALFATGRLDEMDTALTRARQDCGRILGKGNSRCAGILLADAGELDFVRGDYPKVIGECQQAVDILTACGVPRNGPSRNHACALIGVSLTRTGHPEQGEPYLRTAYLDDNESLYVRTCGSLPVALGECLLAQKRYAEAEPLLLGAYQNRDTLPGESAPVSLQAARRLNELYTAWNKPDEAKHFALQSVSPARPSR